MSDRRGADNFRYDADTIVVDDRGYFDFKLFMQRITDKNHFVTRIKDNTLYESVTEKELTDKNSDAIIRDEVILLTGKAAVQGGERNTIAQGGSLHRKRRPEDRIDHQSVRLERRHGSRTVQAQVEH